MHRRVISRFSRRVDLSSSSTASSPSLTCPRAFRSSAIRLNSSESGNENGEATAASSRAPAPKFGNRWGSKQAQRPAGLSAAEQSLREALMAKSKPPPEPEQTKRPDSKRRVPVQYVDGSAQDSRIRAAKQRVEKQKRQGRSDRIANHHSRGKGDWKCYSCDAHVFAKHDQCPFCLKPRQDLPSKIERAEKMRAKDEQEGKMRLKWDWDCPSCNHLVFGWKPTCPNCGCMKPTLQSSRARSLGGTSSEAAKLHKLRREIATEGEAKKPRNEQLDPQGERKTETGTQKAEKGKKDQWSWDLSALEQLESLEAQEEQTGLQKKGKRRDDRQQRRGEAEDAEFDADDHQRRREERKRQKREKERKLAGSAPSPLYLPDFISVSNLADVIGVRPAQFVARMEEMGFEDVTYDHVLDAETAGLVAAEFNYEAIFDEGTDDLQAAPVPDDTSDLPSRPPVVTIMGHVDHGKTTILDWLRKSSVAATEHGGITQHIGAFSVPMPSGKMITFLDTPGHSAFLEMRRRGADVTDIVVLVVAADDSVKPQTIEAIKHATQANVPIIVAISKIDKEGRNPDKVKQDLAVHGVHVEEYGGDVQAIPVSGKTGAGMIELEEAIGALSEMLDHRADTECNAEGWVIETTTKSYGRVTSALIRRGTLRPGDVIVAGTTWARVRTLRNEAGVAISEATPGMPIEIDGWREQPAAGTEILQAPTEQKAKGVVEYRLERSETVKMGEDMAAINEARLEKRRLENADEEAARAAAVPSGPKPVNFIIKADVDGSAEAVLNSIAAIGTNEVYANVLRSGVGPVSEFDVEHAASANGLVVSFNMAIDPSMMRMAEQEGVRIMDHNIIYKLMDDIKAVLSEQLPPSVTQRVTGEAEVQQVFEITVKGREKTAIAGCRVRNGMINKARKVRVIRGNETIYDGTMASLKNVKKDVTEMRKDTECGIGFEDWSNFAVGDHIQCYEEISEKRFL